MAKKEEVRDEDENEVEEPKKKRSILKPILLFVLLPILLIGGTVGGLYFAGFLNPPAASDAAGEDEEADAEDAEATDEEADAEGEQGPAIYLALDPAFVVNFAGEGKARFLQITLDVMARDEKAINAVKQHMPAIRNNLVLLFSSQTYERISTLEGKEQLREETLASIQQILEDETGDPGIEAVYFTSVVMQ